MSDLDYFDDVGEHGHALIRSQSATNASGSHMHVWHIPVEVPLSGGRRIREDSLLISGYDGAHDHSISEDGLSIPASGAHRHMVRLGGKNLGTAKDGPHTHVVHVRRTGTDGSHPHVLQLGELALASLLTADFLRLMKMEEDEDDVELELRSAPEGHFVYKGAQPLCCHADESAARLCFGVKALEKSTGLTVYGGPSHETEPVQKGISNKMLGALEKLAQH